MEAKDTVMSAGQIKNRLPVDDGYSYYLEFGKAIAEAQAEISFKLGATQAIAKTIKPASELYQKALQEGRKEVVEWVEEHLLGEEYPPWQAQKKIWGIKQ